MPPSAVADMMIYLGWSMDGRGAQEGPARPCQPAAERGWGSSSQLGLT